MCARSLMDISRLNVFYVTVSVSVFGLVRGDDLHPVIKGTGTTIRVREHETVFLPCYVDNIGASKITWWKGNDIIASGSTVLADNLVLHPNNTLEVSDVTSLDTGHYTCQVTRPPPWGPINQQHKIEVLYPPRINMTPTGELEVELNEEVAISCYAEGTPKPGIKWLFKGDELKLLNTRNILQFVADRGSLTGEYSCVAANELGDSTSASLYLRVIYPPRVSIERIWVHSSPGMRSEIACDIDGSPHPEVEWHLDNVPISYNHRVHKSRHGSKHSLVITRTTLTDFGYYKCVASNKLGSMYQVVQLSALPNTPDFKKTNQEKYQDRATLAWEIDSYSPINQYNLLFRRHRVNEVPDNWTKIVVPGDGLSSGPIHGQVFTLTGLTPSTVYEAAVMGKNRYGWSRPSSIYRFSTLGTQIEDSFTTEGVNEETNTLNEFLSDYISRTQLTKNYSGSTDNSSGRLHSISTTWMFCCWTVVAVSCALL